MKTNKKYILITGSSGFIGYHISKKFLEKKYNVLGIDSHDNYYPIKYKNERKKELDKFKNYKFINIDITKKKNLDKLNHFNISSIIHLAAQAGVRNADKNKNKFINCNIIGFDNILEFVKHKKINKLIYASSSSVYGNTKRIPTKEKDYLSKPVSFYGLTKSINEIQAENFALNNKISIYGLRFFTVYGEFPRPDMAIAKIFTSIKKNKPFTLYNFGKNLRDFTYVGNVADCIYGLIKKSSNNTHKIFNIGSSTNILINDLIKLIETETNKKIKIKQMGYNSDDISISLSDNKKIYDYLKTKEHINISKGIKLMNKWFNSNIHYF